MFFKTPNHNLTFLLYVAISTTLLLTSCQKENLRENALEKPLIETTINQDQLEQFVLSKILKTPDRQLNNPNLQKLAQEIIQHYPSKDRAKMIAAALSQNAPMEQVAQARSGSLPAGAQLVEGSDTPNNEFGETLAKLGDFLYVGAPSEGKVYIYQRTNTGPVKIDEIASPNEDDRFGEGIAVSTNWLAIGAPATNEFAGVVHIYRKSDTGWTPHQMITIEGGGVIGRTLALERNQLAIVSRFGNPQDGIYIYDLNMHSQWEQTDVLAKGIFFWDIDMSGNRIAGNSISPDFTFSVLVYLKTANGWELEVEIPNPPGSFLSRSVALSNKTLAFNLISPSNISYVYAYKNGEWVEDGTLETPFDPGFVQTRPLYILGNAIAEGVPSSMDQDGAVIYENYLRRWRVAAVFQVDDSDFNNNHLVGQSILLTERQKVIIGTPSSYEGGCFPGFNCPTDDLPSPGKVIVY